MTKQRLEAFTDGVIAIIITIMVLEMKVPGGSDFAALRAGMPVFLAYALSYTNVAIFWNNHHHMLHLTERINGMVLWANLFMLFWLSLTPFVIRWMDETHFAATPTALYGVIMGMAALGFMMLERTIIRCDGPQSKLAQAIGDDRKEKLSLLAYGSAIPLAFVGPWVAIALYVATLGIWFLPDRRIESMVKGDHRAG